METKMTFNRIISSIINKWQDRLFSKKWATYSGREKLAKEISKYATLYFKDNSITRKLLVVNYTDSELIQRSRDITSVANVISHRGSVPDTIRYGDLVISQFFNIACHPMSNLFTTKVKYDTITKDAARSITREVDKNTMSLLSATAKTSEQVISVLNLSPSVFHKALAILLSANGDCKATIIMHPSHRSKFFFMDMDYGFDENIDILFSSEISPRKILVTIEPEKLGFIDISHDPKFIVDNDNKYLRTGFVGFTRLGLMTINDHGVVLIEIQEDQIPTETKTTEDKSCENNCCCNEKEISIEEFAEKIRQAT